MKWPGSVWLQRVNRWWFLFKLQRRALAGTCEKSCPLLLAGWGGQAWLGCSPAGQAGPAWGGGTTTHSQVSELS